MSHTAKVSGHKQVWDAPLLPGPLPRAVMS